MAARSIVQFKEGTCAMRIDAHHHFWDPRKRDYYWMQGPEMEVIRRPMGPGDLRPLLAAAGISGTVTVQTVPDLGETREFLAVAEETDFVCGVVGWADLTSPELPETLASLKDEPGGRYLVGIRHQAHDEEDSAWLTRPDVVSGIRRVHEAGLAYDLLVKERELPAAIACADSLPADARLVVDHIGKPRIAESALQPWKDLISDIAKRPNVWCKISGMVTEADWETWSKDDLRPYVDHVISCFGSERVMFGSDWTVCLLAASYDEVVTATDDLLSDLTDQERLMVFGANAEKFYRLDRCRDARK
jgi:L-fuconolactonase